MLRLPRKSFILPALALGLSVYVFSPGPVRAQASAPFITIPAEQGYRAILERHGQFYHHDQYGVVWLPTSMPQGWRPYSECKWVQDRKWGWLYNDQTEWGRLVHHYGRWAHDERVGWMWLPGAEWSPGWVVWRTSETHVGWAPMPPDVDVARISVEQFNSDKHWTFLDQATFKSGCANQANPVASPADFRSTRVVTKTRLVDGIFVYDVPVIAITIVNINVGTVLPWSPAFIGAIFGQWNHMWNEVTSQTAILNAALAQCTVNQPDRKLNLPLPPTPRILPPAPPVQRRSDLPPTPPPQIGPAPTPPLTPPPPVVTPPPVTPVPPVVTVPPIIRVPPIVTPPKGPARPPKEPNTGENPPQKTPTPPKGPTRPPLIVGPVKDPGTIINKPSGPPSTPPILRAAPQPGQHVERSAPPGPKFGPARRGQPPHAVPSVKPPKPTQFSDAPRRSRNPGLGPNGGGGFF